MTIAPSVVSTAVVAASHDAQAAAAVQELFASPEFRVYSGADVVGVDYRVNLLDAVERLGPGYAVQGNLDPALLFAPWDALEREVRRIVDEGREAPGHIFNLGHGVLPSTDPTVITRVVELVHELGR